MSHKTFISYKHSEALDLRDNIIKAMGTDAVYYNGENGFSPNKSDDTDDAIWNYLKDIRECSRCQRIKASSRLTKA